MPNRSFVQSAHVFDEFDPPKPPPGMTLLGSFRGFWFAATPGGDVWSGSSGSWHPFARKGVWPETPAYRGLSWLRQRREAA